MSHGEGGGLGHLLKTYFLGFDPFQGLHPTEEHGFLEWIGEWGVSRALTLWILFFGLYSILFFQVPNLIEFTAWWLIGTSPIWLPVMLFIGGLRAFLNYVRSAFLATRKPVLLEIKIPREITKSPRAMEQVIGALYVNSGQTTVIDRGWLGTVRPWFAFEVASFGGEVHFYAWCWGTYRRLLESAIYAHYPEVELIEVEDYASKFVYDPHVHKGFCGDYLYFGQGWPGDEYPIKSYIDFELDKDPKEEYKVEPLADMFEVLSSLKPHEQIWIQINIRCAIGNGVFTPKSSGAAWTARVKKAVEQLRIEAAVFSEDTHLTEAQARSARPRGTWRHTEMMMAMERHLGKQPFEVGMRHIYLSSGEFHGPTYTAVRWIWRALNSPNYFNYIRSRRGHNPWDYPWQDFRNWRWNLTTKRYIDAMRRRSFFYTPWETEAQVMSTEMIATLYHFPSSTVKAPGIQRIAAVKAAPPPNLPR
ncbi:MAG: hypothetical protein RIQ56_526 [Candidatus Parcubacteria bacterium]|jgi:hypothetical protein